MRKDMSDEQKDKIAQRNAEHYCKLYNIKDPDKKSEVLKAMRQACDEIVMDEKDPNKLCPCLCGGKVTLSKIEKSSGMDGRYEDWEIFCPKCGGSWYWPADSFYGRKFYSKERVIELWNSKK